MNFRLPKSEKLKSKKTIELLFDRGRSFSKFPVKVFYIPLEGIKKTQVTFAVPKRNFKKAVFRNRIKRQLRETYRLQKQIITTNNSTKFALLFLYIGKDMPKYEILEVSIFELLKKLQDETA